MGRCYFLKVLLVAAVLAISLSQGLGRKDKGFDEGGSLNKLDHVENSEKERATMEFTMDYTDPGANTNPGNGYVLTPPPPPASTH